MVVFPSVLLINSRQLSRLQEKPTAAKLDMLYRKSLFLIALNLGKTQNLDQASVADIHRQYGDHLYSKGDYDEAMKQFVKTIGNIQPSYVIRKVGGQEKAMNLPNNPVPSSLTLKEFTTSSLICKNSTLWDWRIPITQLSS